MRVAQRFVLAVAIILGGMVWLAVDSVSIKTTFAQQSGQKVFLPFIARNATVPFATTSLYMTSVDGQTLYNLGCQVGTHDLNMGGTQDSLVVLDFGYTKYVNGYYGASLMGFGPVSTDQIAAAVESFGNGYYTCTGEDYDSHLTVGIGTNNYSSEYTINASVTYAHGQAWAKMVNQVNRWFVDKKMSSQVAAFGANDMELSWNYPEPTIDWVNGYDSANQYPLLNFGAIPGCPYLKSPGAQCGSYPFLWSREQVWSIIFGANPIYPIPEIYATSGVNAEQWYLMSVYSATQHGLAIHFPGVMTQYQACQQRGGCTGTGWSLANTPLQGWNQLNNLVNSDARTLDWIPWLTDIKWYGE